MASMAALWAAATLPSLALIGWKGAPPQSEPSVETQEEAPKVTDDQIRASEERLEAALAEADAKSNFLATMSHELRTPMNGIIGTSELMMDMPMGEEQREYTHTIHSCGLALLRVINDILDFSKMEAGRLELEQQPFDMASLMEELADLMAPQAHDKGVELVCLLDAALPDVVIGDPGRIRQVVTNLLSNAVKFTRSGAIVLGLETVERSAETVSIRFYVSDSGIGIAEEDLSRIFCSYVQADSSTPRRFGGTGLGLTVCSQLVELMGGVLEVESEEGKGSEFFFTVPLEFQPQVAAPPPQPLQGIRALCIDNTPACREAVERLVTNLGGTVQLAEDGLSALQLALVACRTKSPYDLILLDQRMPGIDGLMLARMLSSQPETASIPLVMTTLKPDRLSVEEMREIGLSASLIKPYHRQRFQRALLDALNGTPLVASDEPKVAAPPPPPRPTLIDAQIEQPEPTGPHILLADDNEFNQTLIRRQLVRLGFSVDVVPHGKAAVQAFDRGGYAAILMDCQMPEMTGYQAATAIRELEGGRSRIPIIALTADVLPGVRERCLDAGMDDYLSKPIWLQALSDVLGRWLRDAAQVA